MSSEFLDKALEYSDNLLRDDYEANVITTFAAEIRRLRVELGKERGAAKPVLRAQLADLSSKLERVETLPVKWKAQAADEQAQITSFARGACFGVGAAAEELEAALKEPA